MPFVTIGPDVRACAGEPGYHVALIQSLPFTSTHPLARKVVTVCIADSCGCSPPANTTTQDDDDEARTEVARVKSADGSFMVESRKQTANTPLTYS